MNIDKDNFEASLAKVKQDIDESEFVAIDLELSGVSFVLANSHFNLSLTYQ